MKWQALKDLRIPLSRRLGYIPHFIREVDPRPAREQIAERYISGWQPFSGFQFNPTTKALSYPGDPPLVPDATARLRDEEIYVYPYDWTLILQPNGEWEVARLD